MLYRQCGQWHAEQGASPDQHGELAPDQPGHRAARGAEQLVQDEQLAPALDAVSRQHIYPEPGDRAGDQRDYRAAAFFSLRLRRDSFGLATRGR